ncbi:MULTISPECIES: hypothetical protein [Burkholderia]|uniref:Uncharacterized protein n=1 Tax=Burkholderia humptydooensis TaxID=430531 RepID=A0A7U4P222_9BURK|nr:MULTISPECIES: hypothetical protein [Burkholderia]ALX41445.1 hypothetical protein AQ610_02750 [Burkholderia humptydooensis]KGD35350.1 hypothetical protein DP44_573 [Burkholderia pseudomallei]KGR92807.1 hypothetical protein X948_1615 [Burkholderia pseudomallei MSHR5608]KGS27487.1 hypothetical protein X962_3924 [Burkholderia pseudomallei MSHR7343]KGS83019.1 hypothetical protein X947_762 [Burkholderia pseudomallei MSHR7334]
MKNYHDAEFIGCEYSRSASALSLSFECADGKMSKLLLSGVRAVRINDFTRQNVVARLLVSPKYQFTLDEVATYVNWASSQHDYRAQASAEKIQAVHADIASGKCLLFVMEQSAGAEAVVLCDTLQETPL